MVKNKKKYLYSLLKEHTGMSLEQFCEQVLKTKYKSFLYRMRKGNIHLPDFITIAEKCNTTLDEICRNEPLLAKYYTLPRPEVLPAPPAPDPEPKEEEFVFTLADV